jgi:Na+(H+)/acetate symporter ActP
MKNDQIIRSVAAICSVAVYVAYLGLNGSGPVTVGIFGVDTTNPLVLTLGVILLIALPEVIDMFPWGPTRSK